MPEVLNQRLWKRTDKIEDNQFVTRGQVINNTVKATVTYLFTIINSHISKAECGADNYVMEMSIYIWYTKWVYYKNYVFNTMQNSKLKWTHRAINTSFAHTVIKYGVWMREIPFFYILITFKDFKYIHQNMLTSNKLIKCSYNCWNCIWLFCNEIL